MRMNPVIESFVSQHFYEGKLLSGGACDYRVLKDHFPHYDPSYPIVIVDVETEESLRTEDGMSYSNVQQVN